MMSSRLPSISSSVSITRKQARPWRAARRCSTSCSARSTGCGSAERSTWVLTPPSARADWDPRGPSGLAPLSAFVGPPLAEEMLRATMRSRAALLDLDPVLAKPAAEEPGQSGAPAVLQAAILRELEENRAKRESNGQRQPDETANEGANPIAQFHARGRFSQAHAVDAESAGDLVARFADAAHDRTRER